MTVESHYSKQDIIDSYRRIGIRNGDTIYVTGNLSLLGLMDASSKGEMLREHEEALKEVVGEDGTIVFPTHSFYLCNTDQVFDLDRTGSETGVLSEYLRVSAGAVRQFHPFSSRAAIGSRASEICDSKSRQSFGYGTPFQTMIDRDARFVSIAMAPNLNCSIVHQAEMVVGVPYRYTKEFIHPVRRGETVAREPFYHFVTYRNCDIVRNRNVKIFANFKKHHKISEVECGRGKIYAYSMAEFFQATCAYLSRDLYGWLDEPPRVRPYQK